MRLFIYPAGFGKQTVIRLLLSVSLFGAVSSVVAQELPYKNLRFHKYALEQGLSQASVNDVLQDRLGYLWFATEDGLNRFDGRTFEVFKNEPGRPNSLSNNQILALTEDNDGKIWIGTGNGLNVYDPQSGEFRRIFRDPERADSLTHNQVFSLLSDGDGRIWVGTVNGLNRLKPDGSGFDHFLFDPELKEGAFYGASLIKSIGRTEDGSIWVGTFGGGLIQLNAEGETQARFQADEDRGRSGGLPDNHIYAMATDAHGHLWLGTNHGLACFDAEAGTFKNLYHKAGDNQTIGGNRVLSVYSDPKGVIWAGTTNGIDLLTHEGTVYMSYRHDPRNPYSLGNNVVNRVYRDRRGLIWVGTFAAGVGMVNPAVERFRHIRSEPHRESHLPSNYVKSFLEDENSLWIGTDKGPVRWFPKENRFKSYQLTWPGSNDSNLDQKVWCFLRTPAGEIWVGSENGLYQYNRTEDNFVPNTKIDADQLSSLFITTMEAENDGTLWLGSIAGLNRIDAEGKITRYLRTREKSGGVRDLAVYQIHKGRRGLLWVAGGSGLFRKSRRSDDFYLYEHDPDDPTSIVSGDVSSLSQNNAETLWVGTYNGLSELNIESGTFTHYGESDGLNSNRIYAMVFDDQGFLWLSTNRGLTRMNPDSKAIRNYDVRDGLQSAEFNLGSAYKDRQGQLYFGGINGFNAFSPASIVDNFLPPPVVLTGFQVLNESVDLGKPVHAVSKIELKYSDYIFSFQFAALDFADPEKNRYAYKMEGFRDEWIDAGNQNTAVFTNLSPGDYTFKVKAANSDGVWNDTGTSVRLTVIPPLWQNWWAYCLYLVAVVLFVAEIARRRHIAHQKELANKQKEIARQTEVNQRLLHIDKLKDEFLANTSHELRTPLNGIIGLAESMLAGHAGDLPKGVGNDLTMIASSGRRLSNLVNDILDFSQLKNKELRPNLKAVDMCRITDVVLTLLRPLTRGKAIELVNDIPSDLPPVIGDENRLQQIMHNLVGNAVKFTDSGLVVVSAEIQGEQAVISVSDTGIGIPEDRQEAIFQSFEQVDGSETRSVGGAGLGLSITKKLVELHGGTIEVESSLDHGSVFRFTLPLAAEGSEVEETPSDIHLYQSPGDTLKVDPLMISATSLEEIEHIQENRLSDPSRFRILLVDDEPVNRRVLVNHLENEGYQIQECAGGLEALSLLHSSERFDLVLLDVMMPKMSGFEVCRRLRLTYSVHELPVIYLTAKNQPADLVHAFTTGANDFLTKPVNGEELIVRVRTHLRLLDTNRRLEQKVAERTQELASRNEEMENLDQIVKTINQELELPRVLQIVLEQGCALFPQAEKGLFFLNDAEDNHFRVAALTGYDPAEYQDIAFSEQQLRNLFTLRTKKVEEGVYLARHLNKEALKNQGDEKSDPLCSLAMAVFVESRLEGFLVLDNFTDPEAFDHSDVRKLERFREHAVSAVVKARYLQSLQRKNEEILRTQRQLITQEKMASLGTLTAGIAHELQNPLNFVNNFAETTLELSRELEEVLEDQTQALADNVYRDLKNVISDLEGNAQIIHKHGRRASQIVQTMMEIARGESGERGLNDVNSLVKKFATVAVCGKRVQAQAADLTVNLDLDEAVGNLDLLPQGLSRVLVNLITNAVEAVLERKAFGDQFVPSIWVGTRDEGSFVDIFVRDNGVGIPADIRDRIFNPFFTTKPTGEHHIGLGLSIAYEMVSQGHEGDLFLAFSEPGSTEFVVRLPKPTYKPEQSELETAGKSEGKPTVV